ncbi:hypothetical protein D3C86_1484790 [compost metagenome]
MASRAYRAFALGLKLGLRVNEPFASVTPLVIVVLVARSISETVAALAMSSTVAWVMWPAVASNSTRPTRVGPAAGNGAVITGGRTQADSARTTRMATNRTNMTFLQNNAHHPKSRMIFKQHGH